MQPTLQIFVVPLMVCFVLGFCGCNDLDTTRAPNGTNSVYSQAACPVDGSPLVFINRMRLSDSLICALENQYQTRMVSGRYWYDKTSGALGCEGGPTVTFILPGLQLGGPLPADISGRGSDVFINGREIHTREMSILQDMLGNISRGEYWLDAVGNLGTIGSEAFANLAQIAASRGFPNQDRGAGHYYGSVSGMGGTVASDGQGGTMFLGRGPGGESISWYSGM